MLAEDLLESSVVADGANKKFVHFVPCPLAPSATTDTRFLLFFRLSYKSCVQGTIQKQPPAVRPIASDPAGRLRRCFRRCFRLPRQLHQHRSG